MVRGGSDLQWMVCCSRDGSIFTISGLICLDECKDHQNHFVLRELQQALFVHVAPGVCWGQESYVRVVWTCCVSAGALKPLLMDVLLVTGQARVWKQLQGRRR